jgi:hypothetical protein
VASQNFVTRPGSQFVSDGTRAVERTVKSKLQDVVSVKDFGAVGDGVTDDTAAIQAAVNEAMKTGKQVLIEGPGPYCISSTITVKVTRDLAPTDATPPSDIHFTDNTSAYILGLGTPTLKATSSIPAIMELIYDTSDSDIGPFYSKVEGIGFDGNGLATTGLKSSWAMHVTIERNRFWNLTRGIEYTGYGVSRIQENVFRCRYGVYFLAGGGDSCIDKNDFFNIETSTSSCIYFGYYSGNTSITSNVFTNEFGSTYVSYGIQLIGGGAPGSEEIRDVVIRGNEFCGIHTAIRADGKASGTKNIYRIIVSENHTNPFSTSNTGCLISAVDCVQIQLHNNLCNGSFFSGASAEAVALQRCNECKVHNNRFTKYIGAAMLLVDCVDTEVTSNTFIDCATDAASSIAPMYGASSARNYFRANYFRQSSGSFGQYGITEDNGVNNTFALDNIFDGITYPYTKLGANSVMRRTEYASAPPSTGRYYQSDIVWNTAPSAGGTPGWICTTTGLPGTWKAMANLAV